MTNRDEQVERVLRQWTAHQEWLGKGYGPDHKTLRLMARTAVNALHAPRTWSVNEQVPDDVDRLGDECDRQWVRDVIPDGRDGWICYLPAQDMPRKVGNVYEIATPVSSPAPPTGVRRGITCDASHPDDDEAVCHMHHHPASPHPWRHHDMERGVTWWEAATPAEQPDPAKFVRLEPAAVRGVAELLGLTAARLTRLNNAYKGPATKHAGDLAQQCNETAVALLQLVGDPDGPTTSLVNPERKEPGGE